MARKDDMRTWFGHVVWPISERHVMWFISELVCIRYPRHVMFTLPLY